MGRMAEHAGTVHPPKIETFDVAARTNTDPKGTVRQVAEYRVEPFGLYLARPAPGRAQFHYLESWLLPGLGLRLTDFWFSPGYERDQDFYLDVVTIEVDGDVWRSTDWYLDIALRDGRGLEVLDTDELLAASAAGLLSPADARRALEITYDTVAGLAAHGYKIHAWLSTLDIELAWRRH
jgi:predicted RNA-binding protein associated with RNAse of E/G family